MPSKEKIARMKVQFSRLDRNGDRTLDYGEMCELLLKGNPTFEGEELMLLFDNVDKNHDGRIDFDEFVDYLFTEAGHDRKPSRKEHHGPERFFYDKSTYTGTSTRGGPSTVDGIGAGGMAMHLRPGMHSGVDGYSADGDSRVGSSAPYDPRFAGRAPATSAPVQKSPPHLKDKPHSGPDASFGPERFFHDQSTYTGVKGHASRKGRMPSSMAEPSQSHRPHSQQHHAGMQGPERFFYDKKTYTGTHRD